MSRLRMERSYIPFRRERTSVTCQFCIPIANRQDGMKCIQLMQQQMATCPIAQLRPPYAPTSFTTPQLVPIEGASEGQFDFMPYMQGETYTDMTDDMLIINNQSMYFNQHMRNPKLWYHVFIAWINKVAHTDCFVRGDDWDEDDPNTESTRPLLDSQISATRYNVVQAAAAKRAAV